MTVFEFDDHEIKTWSLDLTPGFVYSGAMKSIFCSLLLFVFTLNAFANEDIDQTPSSNVKPNLIGQSRIEILGGATTAGNKLGIHYIVNPRLLVGLFTQNTSKLNHQEGGDLDGGQYYSTTSGFSGKAILVSAKYFLKDSGIQTSGWFVSGQLGRSWGKYKLSQDRYERDHGFLGNAFLGIDKKIAESSSEYKSADPNIARVSIGYAIPWVDGTLLKGISLQIHAGAEANSLPENQFLSNKFGSRNVGEDAKNLLFGEIALGAYF